MPSLRVFTYLFSADICRLHRLQNSVARIIFAVSRRTESSQLLISLHWLTVSKRITFKRLLFVFKSFQNQTQSYLSDCFQKYVPARQLRSCSDSPAS
ncbi:hypothetical protein HOLleu_36902 [Holothuria leucospilota]|uniref:Uncharacterized protein n=1 Tax=Holothuria leucospilota TaxID=206669 RepID=A0A9Q0YKN6_HOLLE|nr:hypothetical protein HOLleu_36902 [Holothuria leucospilota]